MASTGYNINMACDVYRPWKVARTLGKSPALRSVLQRLLSSRYQDGPGLKEFIVTANNDGGHQLEQQLEGQEKVPYLRDEDTAGQGRKGTLII